MEEKKIKEIFDALQNERLSERERFVMRKELELLMKEHPLKVPFHIRAAEYMHAIDTAAFGYVGSHGFATATLALVLVFGVGTAYAAGGALPGDVLYPVKISINEKFEGALALSDVEKVEFSRELTERRLEEAEILAARGELTPYASDKIASLIDASANDFEKRVAVLSGAPDNTEIIADAQSTLEASLVAHANVLTTLSTELPDVSKAIKPILSNVQKKAESARASRAGSKGGDVEKATVAAASSTAAKVMSDTNAFEKKVTEKKKKLSERLKGVRTLATKEKNKLGTSTYARFQQRASTTEATITIETKGMTESDQSRVLQDLEKAIRTTEETRVGLKVQINLHDNARAANIDFTSDTSAGNSDTHESDEKSEGEETQKGERTIENVIRINVGD